MNRGASRRSRRNGQRSLSATLLVAAFFAQGFLGFTENPAAVGNRLYDEGKFDEAVGKYGEALIDDPDSPVFNFNMGDAHYKAGNYEDALASFRRVRVADDSGREARIAYNIAAVHYRKATSAEAENPQDALKAYAEALVSYRRVLGIDPTDTDAKFNYELVSRRLADLKKRLEEEKKKQEEQQEEQQQQEQEQEQEQQEDQKPCDDPQPSDEGQQQDAGEPQQNEPQPGEEEQPQQAEQQPQEQEQQAQDQPANDAPQAQEAVAAEEHDGEEEMSQREASALVDAARNDELRPHDFIRRQQGGALAVPAQDW